MNCLGSWELIPTNFLHPTKQKMGTGVDGGGITGRRVSAGTEEEGAVR